MLWKCNLDKKFEGLQECMICFYILHGTNYQPPKLSCNNCKKKFHSACLVIKLTINFSNCNQLMVLFLLIYSINGFKRATSQLVHFVLPFGINNTLDNKM